MLCVFLFARSLKNDGHAQHLKELRPANGTPVAAGWGWGWCWRQVAAVCNQLSEGRCVECRGTTSVVTRVFFFATRRVFIWTILKHTRLCLGTTLNQKSLSEESELPYIWPQRELASKCSLSKDNKGYSVWRGALCWPKGGGAGLII